MTTNATRLREWHLAFNVPILPAPGFPDQNRINLRINLIQEEADELEKAIRERDIVEVADALADLLYVTYGAALEFGIPIDIVFAEVHRSNMTKLSDDGKPIYRDDGKVQKGPNFDPPHLAGILGHFRSIAQRQ